MVAPSSWDRSHPQKVNNEHMQQQMHNWKTLQHLRPHIKIASAFSSTDDVGASKSGKKTLTKQRQLCDANAAYKSSWILLIPF